MNDSILAVLALFRDALKRLFADEAIPLAGNIAFRTIFSIFPFLIFLTTLAGFFGSAKLAEQVVNFLLSVAPEQIIKPLTGEIQSILTVPRSGLLSISAALTIWSAMAGVDSVRVGLNRAYNLKDTRSLWYVYAVNVVFVIGAYCWSYFLSSNLSSPPLPQPNSPNMQPSMSCAIHWRSYC
jgi:membrane protein